MPNHFHEKIASDETTLSAIICFIDSFKLVIHVSGDSFAHFQEHFVYTAFWNNVQILLSAADR